MEMIVNLRPPVTLITLNDEWEEDCRIDYNSEKLDIELLKIPFLHSKYSRIRSHHKEISLALEKSYKDMKELRRIYYEGNSDYDTLTEYKWDQYQGQKVIGRSNQEYVLDTDPVLTKILTKKKLQDMIVEQCDSYIRHLQDRNYAIRGAIESRRYLQGSN